MTPDDLKAAKDAIRTGIADTLYAASNLDRDPIRDSRIVAEAVLASLFSAGFTIDRKAD